MTRIGNIAKLENQLNLTSPDATVSNLVELKLKAFIARARLACQQMEPTQAAALEQQALSFFGASQETSDETIIRAINSIDPTATWLSAVQIAGEIIRGNYEAASTIFSAAVDELSAEILSILTPEQSDSPLALAA